jgi:TonB family protein
MSRRWLIAVSTVAHVAVGVGLFVTGVWQLEQLDRPRLSIALGQPPSPPPPPAGGPTSAVPQVDVTPPKPKPHKPPVLTQPTTAKDPVVNDPGPSTAPSTGGPDAPDSPCLENCGPAAPAVAAVCGNNSLEVGEQCDDGNTLGNDGCSATCQLEPRPKPPTAVISTAVMSGLRLSGDTQIRPSSSTQNRMSRDGQTDVIGSVQLCIATDGSIASASTIKKTNYDEYDQALLEAVRSWRYRPYTVNGAAVKACSLVSFHYVIH